MRCARGFAEADVLNDLELPCTGALVGRISPVVARQSRSGTNGFFRQLFA